MTDQLHGRDLDEAVARAMGWKKPSEQGRCDICGWPAGESYECKPGNCSMRPVPSPRSDQCAAYSTDPTTQAELLVWLRNLRGYSWMGCDIDDIAGRTSFYVFIDGMDDVCRSGATINEALCRLVLAVKEREAKT